MKIENLTTDEAILDELGARIARYRLNRNLTQATLAKEAGVSLSTLKRIELGGYSASIVNYIRILRALKVLENLEDRKSTRLNSSQIGRASCRERV